MELTKQHFLDAIEENGDDEAVRREYADWLLDQGLDDEAAVALEWTPIKHNAALAVVGKLVEDVNSAEECDIEVSEMIKAATAHILTGEDFTPAGAGGSGFAVEDIFADDEPRKREFWEAWSVITGRYFDFGKYDGDLPSFFAACCW